MTRRRIAIGAARVLALGLAFGLTLVMAIGPATGLAAVQSTGPAVTGTAPDAPCCGPTTPTGARLSKFLDGTGVDHLWLIGQRVNWETGETIAASTMPTTTHCSAFVAAIGERLGVYVLRPPQHGQILLANAQMSWLRDAGAAGGWRSLDDPTAAQTAANQGDLVLEAFSNPNPRRPGHIAIVRPSEQSRAALHRDGPRETQAGATNALDTSTRLGFRGHRGAWAASGHGGLRYYAHTIDWSQPR